VLAVSCSVLAVRRSVLAGRCRVLTVWSRVLTVWSRVLAIQSLRGGDRDQAFADACRAGEDEAGRQRAAFNGPREERDQPPVPDDASKRHTLAVLARLESVRIRQHSLASPA
jgi:hypothetical protein